ncbi:hypothetical protein MWU57_10860 [Isoptericola sp. S6320L]|uniref:hypothetical protein n=1 Tax=Isoptericola sp. S6320L TaxID=2926411 RepID=UPI001FF24F86|nr:hypothetical protein [Isoptericola sp. S6320L]MCK0117531.1 hypothetical protein [Isoptericola sp. S6320L]
MPERPAHGEGNIMNLQGPAFEAELAYRRERAAQSFGAPSFWARWRAYRATRAQARRPELAARAREAVDRLADTIDTVADRTDRAAWDARMARRVAEIEAGLAALRPTTDRTHRAA